ncbi:MAG: FAD-dependent oxidoreductase, partial [Sphaerochaeta sp.]
MTPFAEHTLHVDFCVVGGGLAGLCAAVAAARNGLRVALVHDRPMLGGNASSEIRMWISGARGKGVRETGILEEIHMRNFYRNPYKNYSIWDSIL